MDKLSSSTRINTLLHSIGIYSYYDVINHLPRTYENLTISPRSAFLDKAKVTVRGVIVSPISVKKTARITISSFSVNTKDHYSYNIVAFNRAYLPNVLALGEEITLWGTFDKKANQINLINFVKGEVKEEDVHRPIYSLPQGLDNYIFVNLVKKSFEQLKGKIYSSVPYIFINKYHLIDKEDALKRVHFPKSREDIKEALRLLKYEEALLFSLKNNLIRNNNKALKKYKKEPIDFSLCEPFTSSLPFPLTEDQIKASEEIINDMNQNSLMYRLLQGDVGTGKTLVAFIALYANYLRGDQGALMAPTDALARQHYESALLLFKNTKLKIALLVGSTSLSEKHRIHDDLMDGSIDLVIGTHSLFSKSVKYSSLGLVIIDEQHRFGVNQRLSLLDKGDNVDLLMMSATPIPRSLALTLFGDLDVSTLYSYPAKTRNIFTQVVNSEDELIYKVIDKALDNHCSVYVIAPLIEVKEDRHSAQSLFTRYLKRYPNRVSLLHGKLTSEEKEEALSSFKNGEKPILVSTQVVEVGIDVKNATAMVIYDANNFGLASLHQLRGRIGRDGNKSICLLTDDGSLDSERLNVLVDTLDGFKIAEEDMRLRGPGELTGLRQSGLPDFSFLNVVNDFKIFTVAREDANYVISYKEDKGCSYLYYKMMKQIEFSNIDKKK